MRLFGVSVVIPRLPCRDGIEKKKEFEGVRRFGVTKKIRNFNVTLEGRANRQTRSAYIDRTWNDDF